MGVDKNMFIPLGSGGTASPPSGLFGSLLKNGVGSVLGGIDPTGILSGLATQILGKVFESKAARNSRLVQQVLDQSKTDSNVASGTLASYNEYLKQLSRWYTYQYKIKGRTEGSLIKGVIDKVSNSLLSNGFTNLGDKTASQARNGHGPFNYIYPVFGGGVFSSTKGISKSVYSKQNQVATKQSLVGSPDTTAPIGSDVENKENFNPLWLLLLVPIALVAMFFKTIKKIFTK